MKLREWLDATVWTTDESDSLDPDASPHYCGPNGHESSLGNYSMCVIQGRILEKLHRPPAWVLGLSQTFHSSLGLLCWTALVHLLRFCFGATVTRSSTSEPSVWQHFTVGHQGLTLNIYNRSKNWTAGDSKPEQTLLRFTSVLCLQWGFTVQTSRGQNVQHQNYNSGCWRTKNVINHREAVINHT